MKLSTFSRPIHFITVSKRKLQQHELVNANAYGRLKCSNGSRADVIYDKMHDRSLIAAKSSSFINANCPSMAKLLAARETVNHVLVILKLDNAQLVTKLKSKHIEK